MSCPNCEWAERERDAAESALLRHGYRRSCDIPACNCGDQWNHGGHAAERLREIGTALGERTQGRTILAAVEVLLGAERERDEARAERDHHLNARSRVESQLQAEVAQLKRLVDANASGCRWEHERAERSEAEATRLAAALRATVRALEEAADHGEIPWEVVREAHAVLEEEATDGA